MFLRRHRLLPVVFVFFLVRLGETTSANATTIADDSNILPKGKKIPAASNATITGGNDKTIVANTTHHRDGDGQQEQEVDADDDDNVNCTNVDVRNNLLRLRMIENCTVINGYLHMVLMERVTAKEYANFSFPKLREVTGHVLIYRLVNLVSLRDLFPNLMVIRGQQLMGNYALVIYDMSSMIELGLKNLYAIQRGFVYTQHCPLLCHLDTIDWLAITGQDSGSKIMNSFEPPKSACNTAEVCRGCEPKYCWGSRNCQKFYRGYNFNGKIKCHPQCLGGCTGTKETDCNVCRGLREAARCVEQCSHGRLQFRLTNRCITQASCLARGGLLHMNECVLECPAGYSTTNVDRELADFSEHRCYPCNNRCPKVCDGAEIMYLSDVDRVRGCTVINGTLHIRLKEDHPNLLEELRSGLGDIEEIMGILKVFRSNFIASLEFLANLEIIHGQYTNDNANFSLMVYENSNLQRLWNFEYKTSLRILSRGMYFRNNALLCNAHITLLRKITDYDNATDTIDWSSNGYMQACHVEHFRARAVVLSSRNVTVYWAKYQGRTHHRLLGYLIYYIRTNVDKSPYEGRDLCSKFGWKSRFVPLESVSVEGIYYAYNLTRLKPFTRYGFYVKTYFNESLNTSTDQVGLSDMHYFKTQKDRPTAPQRTRTVRKNDTSITLTWQLFPSEQELVSLYQVDVFIEPDDRTMFDQRNYCTHPHDEGGERHDTTTATTAAVTASALAAGCSKEFCCQLLDLEEEEEEEEEEEQADAGGGGGGGGGGGEVTSTDGFFGHSQQSANGEEEGNRRRKKRSTEEVFDTFERNMFSLLKASDTRQGETPGHRRARRETDTETVHFVNRIASYVFTTDNYEYTVEGLEPYRHYIFQLFACSENDTRYCSSYSLHADRTGPSPAYDRLNVTIVTESSSSSSTSAANASQEEQASPVTTTSADRIVLYFPEPTEVNGLTVAYRVQLESLNETQMVRREHCLTRLEHELASHRYTIRDVAPGAYLVRAQAISLAGPAPFTEWMFVRVLAPPRVEETSGAGTGLRDGLIALVVLLLVGGFGGTGAFLWNRWRRVGGGGPSRADDKIPLASNDGNQVNLDDGFVNCSLK